MPRCHNQFSLASYSLHELWTLSAVLPPDKENGTHGAEGSVRRGDSMANESLRERSTGSALSLVTHGGQAVNATPVAGLRMVLTLATHPPIYALEIHVLSLFVFHIHYRVKSWILVSQTQNRTDSETPRLTVSPPTNQTLSFGHFCGKLQEMGVRRHVWGFPCVSHHTLVRSVTSG